VGAAPAASLPTHEAGTADDASASESVDDASAVSTDSDVRDRRVPKRGVTFEFALPGDSSQTATGATPEADATATGATPDSVTTAVGACVPPLSGRATGDPSTAGRGGASAPASGSTDEAAGERKPPGSASELPWETPGTGSTRPAGKSGGCEGAVYVTVDGEQLLSRPAFRAERAGDTTWQSD
jgi:ribonuclease P protein subunit POP4